MEEKITLQTLTKAELQTYKKYFDEFDLNGDGSVSADELDKVGRKMGYRLSRKEIKDIMHAVDEDDSGSLSFEEFLQAMPGNSRIPPEEHKAAECRRKFMEYDADGDGFITVEEAHNVLRREFAFSTYQSVQMVARYDKNLDGQLSYEEFVAFYKSIRTKASQIRGMFRRFDRDQSGSVSVQEVTSMLTKLQIPQDEVTALMDIYDKNKDGELQYEEFVAFLLHHTS